MNMICLKCPNALTGCDECQFGELPAVSSGKTRTYRCHCGGTFLATDEGQNLHRKSVDHATYELRSRVANDAQTCSPATLSLIARILDGGEQATELIEGSLRDDEMVCRASGDIALADCLLALAGTP